MSSYTTKAVPLVSCLSPSRICRKQEYAAAPTPAEAAAAAAVDSCDALNPHTIHSKEFNASRQRWCNFHEQLRSNPKGVPHVLLARFLQRTTANHQCSAYQDEGLRGGSLFSAIVAIRGQVTPTALQLSNASQAKPCCPPDKSQKLHPVRYCALHMVQCSEVLIVWCGVWCVVWCGVMCNDMPRFTLVWLGDAFCVCVFSPINRTCRIAPYLPKMSYISSAEILKGRFLWREKWRDNERGGWSERAEGTGES